MPNNPANLLPEGYRYWAFLSYSHADNREAHRKWADWLHESIETYLIPENLAGTPGRMGTKVPDRLYPVFQDEKELPTHANLGVALETALREAVCLVVICSPRSAHSLWVNQEILRFKQMGRADRILAIIVDGEPNASEPGKEHFGAERECFPEALRYEVTAHGVIDRGRRAEPIAADIRIEEARQPDLENLEYAPLLDRERLRLIAGIAGVGFDDLIQRDKQRELLRALRAKAQREQEANSLMESGDAALRELKAGAAVNNEDFVFARLGAAEDFFQRAGQLNPELETATRRLKEVRTSLVETGIRSGDLNMATVFLARLRQTPGGETAEAAAPGGLQAELDDALLASDSRLHPGLKKAENLSLLSIFLGFFWSSAFVIYAFRKEPSGEEFPAVASPALLLIALPLLPAVWCHRLITRARFGDEKSHNSAVLLSYFLCALGLLTLNPVYLIIYVMIFHTLRSDSVMKLSWRISRKKNLKYYDF